MCKVALLSGITGQDGSILAELLLENGYEVHGIIRRSSSFNTGRIDHIFDRLHLHHGDLTDAAAIAKIVNSVAPDEIYNLGAMSHVMVSFEQPSYTMETGLLGVVNILEAMRTSSKAIKFYQASSSEMFGSSPPPQDESTVFRPQSPYAVAKAAAHHFVANYRNAYGLFACNGILFNHEAPGRRGETFVTRKITRGAARIALGLQTTLVLGNLDAKRDWGHARDYVRAMHMMLQHRTPDDYVVATGEMHTVREFLELVFAKLGLDHHKHVRQDRRYFRPTEVNALCGDYSKIRTILGWRPTVSFEQLVSEMLDHDLALAKSEAALAAREGQC